MSEHLERRTQHLLLESQQYAAAPREHDIELAQWQVSPRHLLLESQQYAAAPRERDIELAQRQVSPRHLLLLLHSLLEQMPSWLALLQRPLELGPLAPLELE